MEIFRKGGWGLGQSIAYDGGWKMADKGWYMEDGGSTLSYLYSPKDNLPTTREKTLAPPYGKKTIGDQHLVT